MPFPVVNRKGSIRNSVPGMSGFLPLKTGSSETMVRVFTGTGPETGASRFLRVFEVFWVFEQVVASLLPTPYSKRKKVAVLDNNLFSFWFWLLSLGLQGWIGETGIHALHTLVFLPGFHHFDDRDELLIGGGDFHFFLLFVLLLVPSISPLYPL